MKKIISFSLWGDDPVYNIGAIKNADIALKLYEGWECWFFVGLSTPEKTIKELYLRPNCKVIKKKEEGDWKGMFWRFEPASDPNVGVMISRDADSRLDSREFYAVKEWVDSDKSFHIIRDHPHHGTEILGGMWGCKYPKLKDMKHLINSYNKGDFWQVDQNFLRELIFPIVDSDSLVHDEFFTNSSFPEGSPPRSNLSFVGQSFNEKDEPKYR